MEITETTDTSTELTQINADLCATLVKNNELHAQVCDLQARNEQIVVCLSKLQDLANLVKELAIVSGNNK
jgi:hypothetical protein